MIAVRSQHDTHRRQTLTMLPYRPFNTGFYHSVQVLGNRKSFGHVSSDAPSCLPGPPSSPPPPPKTGAGAAKPNNLRTRVTTSMDGRAPPGKVSRQPKGRQPWKQVLSLWARWMLHVNVACHGGIPRVWVYIRLDQYLLPSGVP